MSTGFDPRKFTRLLSGKATWAVLYLPASLCPCRNSADGSPSRHCQNCHGYGYSWQAPAPVERQEAFYYGSVRKPAVLADRTVDTSALVSVTRAGGDPLSGVTLEAGHVIFGASTPEPGERFTVTYLAPETYQASITSLRGQRRIQQEGVTDYRDLQLTVDRYTLSGELNPLWDIAQYDRVVVPQATTRVNEVQIRGEREAFIYSRVLGLERVYSIDAGNNYASVEYEAGSDYQLQQGELVWVEDRGPAAGEPYSVSYHAAPEFYVPLNIPHMRHQGEDPLPRSVPLRLWELWPRRA